MTAPTSRATSTALALPGRPARIRPAPTRGAPRRPPLEVVPTRVGRDRVRLLGFVTLIVLVLGLFGAVTSHVALTQGQFRLEELEKASRAEQENYDRLRLDVAQLESPERVVGAAKSRLGMVEPTRVTYLAPAPGTAPDPAVPRAAPPDRPNSVAATLPAWSGGWSTVKPHLAER